MSETDPNQEQKTAWNEGVGERWVAMQERLDAQLEPFGAAVMEQLALRGGERVLDIGCGAGATSIMIAERVRPGSVLGVDISRPLLGRARERAAAIANLSFEEADAQTHAFAKFDAVFSRFGVMFFADPVAAFRNIRASGGRLGFVCWRPMRENPSFTVPISAALPFLPEPPKPTEPGAPGPFAFEDEARVRSILESAGYSDIAVTANDTKLAFGGGGLDAAVDLAFHVGPLSRALPTIPEADRPRVRAAVEEAFAPYVGPSGVLMPAATWIVTAR